MEVLCQRPVLEAAILICDEGAMMTSLVVLLQVVEEDYAPFCLLLAHGEG